MGCLACSGFCELGTCGRWRKHRFRLLVNTRCPRLLCFQYVVQNWSERSVAWAEVRKQVAWTEFLLCNNFLRSWSGYIPISWGEDVRKEERIFAIKLKVKRYPRALLLMSYQASPTRPRSDIKTLGFIRRPQVTYLGFNRRFVGYFGWSFQEQTLSERKRRYTQEQILPFFGGRRKHDMGFEG